MVSQYPRLFKRHAGYLSSLLVFQTIALKAKPHLPEWWITSSGRDETPFVDVLAVVCVVLAIIETVTNRAVLERAHVDSFGEPSENEGPGNQKPLSIIK